MSLFCNFFHIAQSSKNFEYLFAVFDSWAQLCWFQLFSGKLVSSSQSANHNVLTFSFLKKMKFCKSYFDREGFDKDCWWFSLFSRSSCLAENINSFKNYHLEWKKEYHRIRQGITSVKFVINFNMNQNFTNQFDFK